MSEKKGKKGKPQKLVLSKPKSDDSDEDVNNHGEEDDAPDTTFSKLLKTQKSDGALLEKKPKRRSMFQRIGTSRNLSPDKNSKTDKKPRSSFSLLGKSKKNSPASSDTNPEPLESLGSPRKTPTASDGEATPTKKKYTFFKKDKTKKKKKKKSKKSKTKKSAATKSESTSSDEQDGGPLSPRKPRSDESSSYFSDDQSDKNDRKRVSFSTGPSVRGQSFSVASPKAPSIQLEVPAEREIYYEPSLSQKSSPRAMQSPTRSNEMRGLERSDSSFRVSSKPEVSPLPPPIFKQPSTTNLKPPTKTTQPNTGFKAMGVAIAKRTPLNEIVSPNDGDAAMIDVHSNLVALRGNTMKIDDSHIYQQKLLSLRLHRHPFVHAFLCSLKTVSFRVNIATAFLHLFVVLLSLIQLVILCMKVGNALNSSWGVILSPLFFIDILLMILMGIMIHYNDRYHEAETDQNPFGIVASVSMVLMGVLVFGSFVCQQIVAVLVLSQTIHFDNISMAFIPWWTFSVCMFYFCLREPVIEFRTDAHRKNTAMGNDTERIMCLSPARYLPCCLLNLLQLGFSVLLCMKFTLLPGLNPLLICSPILGFFFLLCYLLTRSIRIVVIDGRDAYFGVAYLTVFMLALMASVGIVLTKMDDSWLTPLRESGKIWYVLVPVLVLFLGLIVSVSIVAMRPTTQNKEENASRRRKTV